MQMSEPIVLTLEIGCIHPHSGSGRCDDCVARAATAPTLRELAPRPRIGYADKLRLFNDKFQKHPWWSKAVEGTPLANDLAVMAVEVLDVLQPAGKR